MKRVSLRCSVKGSVKGSVKSTVKCSVKNTVNYLGKSAVVSPEDSDNNPPSLATSDLLPHALLVPNRHSVFLDCVCSAHN